MVSSLLVLLVLMTVLVGQQVPGRAAATSRMVRWFDRYALAVAFGLVSVTMLLTVFVSEESAPVRVLYVGTVVLIAAVLGRFVRAQAGSVKPETVRDEPSSDKLSPGESH